jgi:hypothetical protein
MDADPGYPQTTAELNSALDLRVITSAEATVTP